MFQTKEEIIDWLEIENNISKYTVNDDLSVDLHETIRLRGKELESIPIQFNKVDGDFIISHNYLTSLKGSPKEVTGSFLCSYNHLESLEYAPVFVGENFICKENKLTSLMYIPKIGKNIDLNSNLLASLKYLPQEVFGRLNISDNKLQSLNHCSKKIGRDFQCSKNQLTNLENGPVEVGGIFDCSNNNLTSLKGIADFVGDYLDIGGNPLNVCDFLPKVVNDSIYMFDTKISSLKGFNCDFKGRLEINTVIKEISKYNEDLYYFNGIMSIDKEKLMTYLLQFNLTNDLTKNEINKNNKVKI